MSSTRRRVAGAAGVLALAALIWTGPVQAGTAGCQKDLALIGGGAPGPLDCVSSGTPTILVRRSAKLALKTVSAVATRVRTAGRYTISVRGQPPATVKPKGVFILITVTVTNVTRSSHVFDAQNQVALEVGDNTYFPNEFADSRLGLGAFLTGPSLRPGESATGDLVIDVPKSVLRTFPAKSGLAFVNFGQNTSSGFVSQLGVIVLAGGH